MISKPFNASKSNFPHFNLRAIDIRPGNGSPGVILENVHEFTSIKLIRELLSKKLKVSPSSVQLFHPNNPIRSIELKDSQSLHDLKVTSSVGFVEYCLTHEAESFPSAPLNSLTKRISISPATIGTSGVYIVESLENHTREVFKPADEEQGMINNPKGFNNKPLKANFEPGQGMIREYVAYLMDVGNFCKIPRTRLVRLEDETFSYNGNSLFPKIGALQEFVPGGEEICEYGSDMFSDLQIQKIALLDLRLLNCDRNDENVLVVKKSSKNNDSQFLYELYPIDHGYCLPAQLRIECWDWFWINYPQVRKPICPEIVEYFKSIDIDSLVETILKEVTLSANSVFLIKLAHQVILKSIEKGLTLYDIARIIARHDEQSQSPLEKIVYESESNSYATLEARSSRANVHANLSNSLDMPKNLSFVPDEIRNRSYSLSDSSPGVWNSPIRQAIFSSADSFISRMNNSELASPTRLPTSVFDSDAESTDSSCISAEMTDFFQTTGLTGYPIRARSNDSYINQLSGQSIRAVHSVDSTVSPYRNLQLSPALSLEQFSPEKKIMRYNSENWNVSVNSESLSKHYFDSSSTTSPETRTDNNTPNFLQNEDDLINLKGTSNPQMYRLESANCTDNDDDVSKSVLSDSEPQSVLRRIVSFTAKPSPPMYEGEYEEKLSETLLKISVEPIEPMTRGRRVSKKALQQHLSYETTEFQNLRKRFADTLVTLLVKKIAYK